jgi:hypothetical protein
LASQVDGYVALQRWRRWVDGDGAPGRADSYRPEIFVFFFYFTRQIQWLFYVREKENDKLLYAQE